VAAVTTAGAVVAMVVVPARAVPVAAGIAVAAVPAAVGMAAAAARAAAGIATAAAEEAAAQVPAMAVSPAPSLRDVAGMATMVGAVPAKATVMTDGLAVAGPRQRRRGAHTPGEKPGNGPV
jgi:hypothetical protein